MSSRYQAIVALLDDPTNVAAFLREYQRRDLDKIKILPPAVPREGGGYVFPTFRTYMREVTPAEYGAKDSVDSVYDIYTDGKGWFVYSVHKDEELGPFDDRQAAFQQAVTLAGEDGWVLLDKRPWEGSDVANWTLR